MATQDICEGSTGTTELVEFPVKYRVLNEILSIDQLFNKKYLVMGAPDPDVLEVAQEAHKELHFIANSLGLRYGDDEDGKKKDHNLEMLFTCRKFRDKRAYALRDVIVSMSTGTFSLKCQKRNCPRYTSCPDRHNLTEIRKALPEAEACLWFRQQYGSTLPIPEGRRVWGV